MKTNALVSVIIVNWNGKRWLKRLMDSLQSQSYSNIEIILVDNGSSDDSVAFINKNFPKVKIITSKQNLGFAGGNNLGIAAAKGELILLINNDTWIADTFVDEMMTFYANHDYDVIAPYEADYEAKPKTPYITTIDLLGHPVYKYGTYDQDRNFYLSGACILFSKRLYKDSGGLDNNFFMYFEEIDWFWRLHLMRKRIAYVDGIYINHAGAGSTGTGIKYKSFLWRNENTLQMILKNYGILNLVWAVPLYLVQNIGESIAFLFVLKPKIAYSYLGGVTFNFQNIRRTLRSRKTSQKLRSASDKEIKAIMFKGPGKLVHLFEYFR